MGNIKYTASMTGEPYLYYESKEVAKLIIDGLDKKQIIEKVKGENLFQYKTTKSINKRVNSVYKRLKILDNNLLKILVEGDIQSSKYIVLYSIIKTNRLFYEFMKEVIKDKISYRDSILKKSDLILFFERKREESIVISNWKEETFNKLIQVFIKILDEANILDNIKNKNVNPPIIEKELKDYFIKINEKDYLNILGGNYE